MQSTLQSMFNHMTWADARVVALLLNSDPTRVSEAVRLMSHVVAAERVWLQRIRADQNAPPIWPDLSLPEIRKMSEENGRAFRELIAGLENASQSVVEYRNSRGDAFRTRLDDILTHVALHGAYHRGQIATALRAAGIPPSSTDYIVFVREQSTETTTS